MKAIILSFIITTGLLLIGCSGVGGGGSSGGSSSAEPLLNTTADGGGDRNNGGGGGNGNGSNGDGGGERPSLPAEVELSISPFIDGLRIQWHNLSAIEGAGGIYIHLNLTGGNPPQPDERKVAIEDFSDDSYEIDGLDNGTAYRLVGVRVEQANNTFWVIDNITWSEPWEAKTNALDNDGNGIVVGANHDGDGRADRVDEDDDNDGRPNSRDDCRLGEIGWNSENTTLDYDSDGCRNDEDPDSDNDGILNENEAAPRCVLDSDCDDDNQRDNVDIDDDGDGLIEISTAKQLDAVRWVLNGTGFKANATAELNQTGCGDGIDMTVCNGYELVGDISLTDYIADNYPMVGWRPIAPDGNTSNLVCDGGTFSAIFDGNGFVVSGLFINRSTDNCIGLFGQVSGIIFNLGVVADRIIGNTVIGTLVGVSKSAKIVQSYVVSGEIHGPGGHVGGLVGEALLGTEIVQSYAVGSMLSSRRSSDMLLNGVNIAGLVGVASNSIKVIQSYAMYSEIEGASTLGGLVGSGVHNKIIQSYAVVSNINARNNVAGGLVANGRNADITHSYAVSGIIRGGDTTNVGGLVGFRGAATASYWDTETSGRTNSAVGSGNTTSALRSPTDYTDIYDTWDDGVMVDGINDNTTIWCDEDQSGMIEDDERQENNKVWDFGTATDYPALRCTPDSLADQRAWWFLNTTSHKPQLNQTRLDAYLDGSLP